MTTLTQRDRYNHERVITAGRQYAKGLTTCSDAICKIIDAVSKSDNPLTVSRAKCEAEKIILQQKKIMEYELRQAKMRAELALR